MQEKQPGAEADVDLRVERAWRESCSYEGGFLSPVVPLDRVPAPFDAWQRALEELPDRYHRGDESVRPWLDATFGRYDPLLDFVVDASGPAETDKLFTVVSFLAHAYRWQSAPPPPGAYQETRVVLPEGLARPWARLASKLGVPRVGNLYAMLACNWRLAGRTGGDAYENHELTGDRLELRHLWLRAPESQEIRAFILTVIETEARGALALRTIVSLVRAAARENRHEFTYLLDRLRAEIEELGRPFKTYVQKKAMKPDHFLTLIQPTFIWALDEGDGRGPLEGASGPQVGALQAVDAVLSVRRATPMAQAILKSRAYMQPRHRGFLELLEREAVVVRAYVDRLRDPQATGLFNACVAGMESWRRVHRQRGGLYLKGEQAGAAPEYRSTGLVVSLEDDRVAAFDRAMDERMRETVDARIAADPLALDPLQSALRFLDDGDRVALLAGAERREFPPGSELVRAGTRRSGLTVVRTGTVRVERVEGGRPVVLARLGEGALLGEISFVENEDASADVVADGPVTADVVPREHVFSLIADRPGFGTRFYQSIALLLSARLRGTSSRLPELVVAERPLPPRPRRLLAAVDDRSVPEVFRSEVRSLVASAENGSQEAVARLVAHAARLDSAQDVASLAVLAASLRPLVLAGPLGEALLLRPRGYVADTSVHALLAGPPSDKGLDVVLAALPTLRAVSGLPDAAARALAASRTSSAPAHVAWLGRDSVQGVLSLAANTGPFDAWLLEPDADACTSAERRLRDAGLQTRVTVQQVNALRLSRRRDRLALPLLDAAAVDLAAADWTDHDLGAVLSWLAQSLRPDGVLVLAALPEDSADAAFVEHVLDWPLVRRDPEAVRQLLDEAGFRDGIDIRVDVPTGALVALARRK